MRPSPPLQFNPTHVLALLGDPVEHSLSPLIHNAAFHAAHMRAVYLARRVEPARLGAALEAARVLGFLGLNLTVPHKSAVLAHLDEVDDQARRIRAVNTVVFRDGRAAGCNTDADGFLWSLRDLAHFDPSGCRAVVVGAGGGARAVAVALADAGAERVDVVNRTRARAEALLADLRLAGKALAPGEGGPALAAADLVVNCTTQGMWPEVEGLPPADATALRPSSLVVDTIYNPRPTRWLQLAQQRGCRTLDGLGMLAGQAALAWKVWFGSPGPARQMLAAAAEAMQRPSAPQSEP